MHRVLLTLIYSGGLRLSEVSSLLQQDIEFDRKRIHIRRSKYGRDRYTILSDIMTRGLKK